jgi:hypothetical protein
VTAGTPQRAALACEDKGRCAEPADRLSRITPLAARVVRDPHGLRRSVTDAAPFRLT